MTPQTPPWGSGTPHTPPLGIFLRGNDCFVIVSGNLVLEAIKLAQNFRRRPRPKIEWELRRLDRQSDMPGTSASSITGTSSLRATCWSLTINNPTDADTKVELPSGWKLTGQYEQGAEGTNHFQGMLITPQVRFAAVKRVFPRAHIEVAKNRKALEQYVHKDDTRVGEFANRESAIPTLWDYQRTVASKWLDSEFEGRAEALMEADSNCSIDDCAMSYLDTLVSRDIEAGMRGVEFIAINPMWRSSWKKFWRVIIKREKSSRQDIENGDETA